MNEIVGLTVGEMLYKGISHYLIMIRNLTPIIRYEKLKIENHFYEMLTATVSHDLRTPLNAMIGLHSSLEMFISND